MKYLTRLLACALIVIGLAASGAIGQDVYTGTVTRIDQPAQVIIFQDGRMYRVTPSTVLLANNQPVAYTALQPGTYVVVRSAEPVTFQNGQYVVLSSGAMAPAYAPIYASPAFTSPSYTTTVTTVTTPQLLSSASGVVAAYDPRTNIVTLTDGRMVQISSKTAILVNGFPTAPAQLRPGMPVMLSAVNPVVSRDGRSVVLNEGFFDPGNGSPLTWDSKFAGYEGQSANAAMQPQAN
jgi:hypothetical protein